MIVLIMLAVIAWVFGPFCAGCCAVAYLFARALA